MTWLSFIAQLWGPLLAFAKWLYERHHGDVKAATAELQKMPDEWAAYAASKKAADARIDALEKG
jgi:hypothetical protein